MNHKLLSAGCALLLTLLAAWRAPPEEPTAPSPREFPKIDAPAELTTRHVQVPDDADDWYLLVSHHAAKSPEERRLLGWFTGDDPRLTALWNDSRIKSAPTGPGYRGYDQMWYADVLHPPAVALLDATGERIYLARGKNVPGSAAALVCELNRAIAAYHARHGVTANAPTSPAHTAGLGEPAGRLHPLTWPFKILRWVFGRRPCPPAPEPTPPTPEVEPVPREPLAALPDNAEEPASRPWLSYLLSLLLGGGLSAAWKLNQELE